jgi:hypothetical protein
MVAFILIRFVTTQVSCHKGTKIIELFVGVHRFRVHRSLRPIGAYAPEGTSEPVNGYRLFNAPEAH